MSPLTVTPPRRAVTGTSQSPITPGLGFTFTPPITHSLAPHCQHGHADHFHPNWHQARSQDFTLGAQKLSAEGARIDAPKSPRVVGIGETHFWHIWGPQNTSGRENSPRKTGFSVKKIHSFDDWGEHGPLPPSEYAPDWNYRTLRIGVFQDALADALAAPNQRSKQNFYPQRAFTHKFCKGVLNHLITCAEFTDFCFFVYIAVMFSCCLFCSFLFLYVFIVYLSFVFFTFLLPYMA